MKKVILAVALIVGAIGVSHAEQCHLETRPDFQGHQYYINVCRP